MRYACQNIMLIHNIMNDSQGIKLKLQNWGVGGMNVDILIMGLYYRMKVQIYMKSVSNHIASIKTNKWQIKCTWRNKII